MVRLSTAARRRLLDSSPGALPHIACVCNAPAGAHSLVNTDCPEWTVSRGVPARVVAARPREQILVLEQQLRQQQQQQQHQQPQQPQPRQHGGAPFAALSPARQLRRHRAPAPPTRAAIVGLGGALPPREVPNAWFAAAAAHGGGGLDTSDDWIRSRTGIGARRVLGACESFRELVARAARHALTAAYAEDDNPADVAAPVSGRGAWVSVTRNPAMR